MPGVHPCEQVELSALIVARHIGRSIEIDHRRAFRPKQRALKCRGQESGTPVQIAALDSLVIPQHDKTRQAVVF